jgi:hypothetical protein
MRSQFSARFLSMMSVLVLLSGQVPVQADEHLDLASSSQNVTVGSGQLSSPAVIKVGGSPKVVNAGDVLTAAEFTALTQVVNSGSQRLVVDVAGRATAGSFVVNELPQALAGMTIPSAVTAIHDFGTTGGALNFTGNLINAGKFFAVSTNAATTTASISAVNILNQQNGLLSTVLPSEGLPDFQQAIAGLNLSLSAVNDITNAGTISSSGSLTATAGGSIANALPGGVTGNQPIMQAVGDLNLHTANLVNAGLLDSTGANVNIANQTISNLLINNTGGIIQAPNGNINVGEVLNTTNAKLRGGDWFSSQLNVNTGGKASIYIGQVSGLVNVSAKELQIAAATEALRLGQICLEGDPTFYNSAGSIFLNSGFNLTTNGAPIAIVAQRNIYVNGATPINIDTSSPTGGGSVFMLAGAEFTVTPDDLSASPDSGDSMHTLTITGRSLDGGEIDLTSGPGLGTINTRGTSGDVSGGDVYIWAWNGLGVNSGRVFLPSASSITTGGSGSGANGLVFINAAYNTPLDVGLTVGSIDTTGGSALASGSVILQVSDFELAFGVPITVTNGSYTGFFDGTNPRPTGIQAGAITVPNTAFTFNIGAGDEFVALGPLTIVDNGATDPVTLEIEGHQLLLGDIVAPGSTVEVEAGFGSSTRILIAGGSIVAGDLLVHLDGDVALGEVTITGGSHPSGYRNGLVVFAAGDVSLAGPIVTNGGSVAIVSEEGSIFSSGASPLQLDTSSLLGGGDVLMVAGAEITFPLNKDDFTTEIFGANVYGGHIDLTANSGTSVFTTSGLGNSNGGDVTLIAFGGLSALSGQIKTPTSLTITTGGASNGTNGDINVVAGDTGSGNIAISLGSLDTSGGNGTGGKIELYAALPVLTVDGAPSSSVQIVNGALLSSPNHQIVANVASGLQDNNIVVAGLTATGSTGALVKTGGSIALANGTYVMNGHNGSQNTAGPKMILDAAREVSFSGNVVAPGALLDIHSGVEGFSTSADIIAGAINIDTNGDINLQNVASVGGVYTLSAAATPLELRDTYLAADGNINASGILCCYAVTFRAGGDIGSATNRILLPDGIQLDVQGSQSAFLTSQGDITVLPGSFVGMLNTDTLDIATQNNGDVIFGGIDAFGALLLGSTPTLNPIGSQATLRVAADGSGQIRQIELLNIFAGQAIFTSQTGDIGLHNLTVDNVDVGMWVHASNIEARTAGSVLLAQTATPGVSALPSVLISNSQVGDGQSLTYESEYRSTTVTVGSNVTAGNNSTIDITSRGHLVVTGTVNAGSGSTVALTSLFDDVVLSPTSGPAVSAGVGSNVTLAAGDKFIHSADVTVAGGGSISVVAAGGIQNSGPGPRLGAGTISLEAANGDIGTSSSPIATFTENLNIAGANNAYIASEAFFPMNLGFVNAATFDFTTGGDVTATSVINAGSASITSANGSIYVNENINASTQVALTANNGSITNNTVSPSAIEASNGNASISTAHLINNGDILADTISVNSPSGQNLLVSGTGAFTSNDTRLAAPGDLDDTNTVIFDDNSDQRFHGPTTLIANGNLQPNIQLNNGAVALADSSLTLLAHGYTQIGSSNINGDPLRLVTPNGAGVISGGSLGDVTLNSNLVFLGKDLTIISSRNIIAGSKLTSIDLHNANGDGGSLTLIAGYNFSKDPSGGSPFDQSPQTDVLVTVTGPSNAGGSIIMPNVAINTSSTTTGLLAGQAGNVVAVAHKGSENVGSILLKSVNASGVTNSRGGDITLIGNGGVKTSGALNTSGTYGGKVTVIGAEPKILGGPMIFQNGYPRTAAQFSYLPVSALNGAAAIIGASAATGFINTSGTNGTAGDVTIRSDSYISVAGNITAVAKGYDESLMSGGVVSLSSLTHNISTSNIDVSGAKNTAFPTLSQLGGTAGQILLSSPATISTGNLLARGGSRTGLGSGGDGGLILVTTKNNNAKNYYTGAIAVNGFIDATGGDGDPKAAGSTGGDGGLVTLTAGTVQVLKAQSSVSIDVSGGLSNGSLNNGVGGAVVINTYGVQPFPQNFNLSSSTTSEAVLPGGLFTVGSPKVGTVAVNGAKPPLNGTLGWINTGSTTQALKVSSITDTTVGPDYNQLGVMIDVTGGSENYQVVNANTLANQTASTTSGGLRQFVTPATAVALFATSRGMTQEIGINGTSGVAIGLNPSIPGSGAGTAPAFIRVDESDIRSAFSNFTFATTDANSDIRLSITGQLPLLNLSSSTNLVKGRITFATPDALSLVHLGGKSVKIDPIGRFETDATGSLVFTTTASTITNGGSIKVGERLAFLTSGTSLTIKNEQYTLTNGTLVRPFLTGVSGASDPRLVIPATGTLPAYTVKNAGGFFFFPISFEGLQLPTSFGSIGSRTLPTTASRNINLTAIHASPGSGSSIVPGTLTVRGEILGNSINIKTLATSLLSKPETNLVLGTGTYVYSYGKVLIDSCGTLVLNSASVGGGTKTAPLTLLATKDITSNDSSVYSNYKGVINSKLGAFRDVGNGLHGSFDDSFTISAEKDITLNPQTSISAAQGLTIQSRKEGVNLAGDIHNIRGVLQAKSLGALLSSADLSSGELTVSAPATGNLTNDHIAKMFDDVTPKKGSIILRAEGTTSPSRLELLPGANVVSNGGDVVITATADVIFSTPVNIAANGGNVVVLAKGVVRDTNNPLISTLTSITARAIGTPDKFTGGGIELGSVGATGSLTTSAFPGAFSTVTTVPASSLAGGSVLNASNITIDDNGGTGAIKINSKTAEQSTNGVDLVKLGGINQSLLTLNGGAIVFDVKGAVPGIEFDGIVLNVSSYKPIAYTAAAHASSAFMEAREDTSIETDYGLIRVRRGAILTVEGDRAAVRIKALSGPKHIAITIGEQSLSMAPGQEVLLTPEKPTENQLAPRDGVGRRKAITCVIGKSHVTVSDFSITSLVQSADYMQSLRLGNNAFERQMMHRLLKTAAAIQMVTSGKRGAYVAKPKPRSAPKLERFTTAHLN